MDWLLKLIGAGDSLATRLDQVQLMWTRPALLWLGLALMIPLSLFIVWRHRTSLAHISPAARGWLSACRIGVLLLLVLVVGGPYLRLVEPVKRKPVLALLIDESASMQLPSGPFEAGEAQPLAAAAGLVAPAAAGKAPAVLDADVRKQLNNLSRQDLVERVFAAQRKTLLDPLGERFDLRIYRAARNVRQVALNQMNAKDAPAADLDDTDLGAALETIIGDAAGQEVAGVVIVSDGQNTTGPDPLQVLRRYNGMDAGAAAVAVPVWSVPVGSAQPPADIRVVDVLAPTLVTEGDRATVVATIQSAGFAGRAVAVQLLDGESVCDTSTVTLAETDRRQVQLTYQAKTAGSKLLTVHVDEQPEEQVKQNNRQSVFIDIDTQRRKILYLEGAPRWDFRFLDHALRRDKGLDVTVIVEALLQPDATATNATQAAATNEAAQLPKDAAGFAAYGVVMLGDISPQFFPARLQEQLAKAVREQGIGLIVQAGPGHMPHEFLNTPLGELLPVVIEPASGQGAGHLAPGFAPFTMKLEAEGALHPAFHLYDSASPNRDVWGRMPPFYWSAGVSKAKPGAAVLATVTAEDESRPLIVEHVAGRGRVLFIGTDETYRWRRNIGEHLFYRFWGQALRHAASDSKREADASWVEVSPRRVEPGDPVSIELYAVNRRGNPLKDARVIVSVTAAGRPETLTLKSTETPGHYRATWAPPQIGVYRVDYTDSRDNTVNAYLQAAGSGRELTQPTVNRDMLGALADAARGELVELSRLNELPGRLKGKPVTFKRTRDVEIWDNWLTLVLLIGFYCTDVGIRRMLGLT
jgi:hypothetical protein